MSAHTDVRDIEDRSDCERLVRAFYAQAMTDPMIGFIFTDVARLDLDEHIPVITAFWETMLLGAGTYSGGAFHVHAVLNEQVRLRPAHFERWVVLWSTTVDELFAGERAELAKAHAVRVARAFSRRLEGLDWEVEGPAPLPAGLAVTRHGPQAA